MVGTVRAQMNRPTMSDKSPRQSVSANATDPAAYASQSISVAR
jgi:hypothetical protein